MKYLFFLFFIGRTRIQFLLYSYSIDKYLLPLLKLTGNLTVRLVSIRSWGSMILVKTWLECVSNLSIGSSLFRGVICVLVELIFFLIFFMWPFAVAMELGR